MPLLLILIVLMVFAPPVQALEHAVSMTQKECERLIRKHSVSGADYVPAKDARGNDVVPADLNSSAQLDLPDEIIFDIGIDLAEKYGIGAAGQFSSQAILGQIKVKGRKVYWNDQQLNKSEKEAVLEACRKQYEN